MWNFIDKTTDIIFSETFEAIMAGILSGLLLVEVAYQIADKLSK